MPLSLREQFNGTLMNTLQLPNLESNKTCLVNKKKLEVRLLILYCAGENFPRIAVMMLHVPIIMVNYRMSCFNSVMFWVGT
jgi:hypothetical protein